MKTLMCKDLGGPCDTAISGESFNELAENCKNHVMEEIGKGDAEHIAAVQHMKNASPEDQQKMIAGYKARYEEAPEA